MLIKSVLATEAVYCLRDICSVFTELPPQCLEEKKKRGGLQSELTLMGHVLCVSTVDHVVEYALYHST